MLNRRPLSTARAGEGAGRGQGWQLGPDAEPGHAEEARLMIRGVPRRARGEFVW